MCYGPSDYRAVTNISIDSLLIKRVCSIIPTAHNSDSPLLRQPITPTAHYSDNPLFRQPIVPTANNLAQQRMFFMTSGPGKKQQSTKQLTANLADEIHDEMWMNSNVPEEHAASAYMIAAIQGCTSLSCCSWSIPNRAITSSEEEIALCTIISRQL
jgi:hypothetical protein